METEVLKAVVINPVEFGLDENQGAEIESQFLPVIADREDLAVSYSELIVKEITPAVEKEAYELRRKLVKVRTDTDRIHKAAKAFYLAGGRFVDAWKNKNNTTIELMELKLKEIETTTERAEREKIIKIENARITELSEFTSVIPINLGIMPEDVYQNYLVGIKHAYAAKIEAERKAEEERLAAIKAEAEERERIRIENENLKAEAIQKERELELERKKQAEELAKQKAAAEAEAKEKDRLIQIEREKQAKLEAELKTKQAEELKAKQEAERKEKERIEAEKQAAKAPDKEKMQRWIDSLNIAIPELSDINAKATANVISEKFESFKKWAKQQIETV